MVGVRDATREDLPEITAIFNALLATTTYAWTEIPYSVAEREDWLAKHTASGRPALVAVDASSKSQRTGHEHGSQRRSPA